MFDPTVNDRNLFLRAAASSTSTLHEAGARIGALPPTIRPLAPTTRVCGPAYPVQCAPGDNLWLHHAIYEAEAGDVLVIHTGGALDCAYWGEVLTVAAQQRGIAGIVLHGGVRDVGPMIALGFPVFSTTPCIRGPARDESAEGSIGTPVRIGDVVVARGDLVLGDADGVIVLPAAQAARIVADAQMRDLHEKSIFERLRAGERTLDIYGLPLPLGLRQD